MATKKHVPAKPGKAPGKADAKKTAKAVKAVSKTPVKVTTTSQAGKTAAKKPASTVKSAVKQPVKPVQKQAGSPSSSKKPADSPTTKKAPVKSSSPVKITKSAPLPVKSLAKPPAKKATNVKNAETKTSTKTEPVKKVKAANPAQQIMAKKEENKNQAANAANEKSVQAKPAAEVKAKDIKVPAPKPVVIPKIATKTVRKYQPEFTKSVLDKTQRDPGAPSQRYSDAELQEFRELIQRKLDAAKKELSYLHGLITRKDEMGGDEGDNRYMTMEDGSLSMEREQLSQMASRQITFIDHLEKAVMRIENKTYGICRITGKLIDKARLRAVPHATLSIEAKMGGK